MEIVARASVLTVGAGRGFVVETYKGRLVVTAAHCLPHLPPAASMSFLEERTYAGLLGRLGQREPKVWAECLFADPVADVAVLGAPDGQELWDECKAFESFMEPTSPLRIGEPFAKGEPPHKCRAQILTLDERWVGCVASHFSHAPSLWIEDAAEPIVGGMSGSPILDTKGKALGVLVCSAGPPDEPHMAGGPFPKLTESLPRWLVQELTSATPGAVTRYRRLAARRHRARSRAPSRRTGGDPG